MTTGRDQLTNPGRNLSGLALPAGPGGTPVPVIPRGRRATVLVLVHPGGCEGCLAYLRRLAEHRPEVDEWDGRVVAVAPERAAPDVPFPVVVDATGRTAGAVGVVPPAVVVVDQWAEVHAAEAAGADHAFVDPAGVVDWLRYLAVRCPECEGEAL